LGVSQHRDVRVTHRPANRHPSPVDLLPPVETGLALRVQLGKGDPPTELRLGRSLAPGEPHPTMPATARQFVPPRIDLVRLPDRGTLLVIQNRRLTLQGAGAEHGPLLNQVADRATERGPGLLVRVVL